MDAVWLRLGGVAGVLSFLALVATKPIGGASLIHANSSAAQIAADLSRHPSRTLASNAVTVIGLVLFLWFASTVARLVHTRDTQSPLGFLLLASGLGVFIAGSIDAVTQSALVFLSKEGPLTADPALTRLTYIFYNGMIQPGIMAFAIAIFLVAIGAAALRGTVAARWVGWLSLGFAPISALGGILSLTVTNGGNSAPPALGVLGDILTTVIVSVFLLRQRHGSPAAVQRAR